MGYTSYLWDPVSDCVLQEYDGDENLTAEYTSEPAPFGPVLSQYRDDTTSDLIADALGSTRLIVDETAAVTDSFAYDAWGQELDRTGTTETPYRWVGKWGYYADDEFGSAYVRGRTYMPTLAQWLSMDLLKQQTRTVYSYVWNRPVTFVDASGLRGYYLLTVNCPPPPSAAPLGKCGTDVSGYMTALPGFLQRKFSALSTRQKLQVCDGIWSRNGWDINEFFLAGGGNQPRQQPSGYNPRFEDLTSSCGTVPACQGTVTINNRCYWAAEANYYLWGRMNRICSDFYETGRCRDWAMYPGHGSGGPVTWCEFDVDGQTVLARPYWSLDAVMGAGTAWRWGSYWSRLFYDPNPMYRRAGVGSRERRYWTQAGWLNDLSEAQATSINSRCSPCGTPYTGVFTIYLGPRTPPQHSGGRGNTLGLGSIRVRWVMGPDDIATITPTPPAGR